MSCSPRISIAGATAVSTASQVSGPESCTAACTRASNSRVRAVQQVKAQTAAQQSSVAAVEQPLSKHYLHQGVEKQAPAVGMQQRLQLHLWQPLHREHVNFSPLAWSSACSYSACSYSSTSEPGASGAASSEVASALRFFSRTISRSCCTMYWLEPSRPAR